MAARTRNTYLSAIKAFTNWCVENERLLSSPVSRIKKANEKADCRHQRRALTHNEMQRLLKVARLRLVAQYGRSIEFLDIPANSTQRTHWRYAPLTFANLGEVTEEARRILTVNNPPTA